ncbi:hypothetical protein A0J61_03897, partial [Choanephora cucurbitarum]
FALLVGKSLAPKLGITIPYLAYTFDEQEEVALTNSVDDDEYISDVNRACLQQEYELSMREMQSYLNENKNITLNELCLLKEAVVYLKTPPNKMAFTRQHLIVYDLILVIREQIAKWLKDETIETVKLSKSNSSLTLAPKATGDGTKKYPICLDTRPTNLFVFDISGHFTDWGSIRLIDINSHSRSKIRVDLYREFSKMSWTPFLPIRKNLHAYKSTIYKDIESHEKHYELAEINNILRLQATKAMMKFCSWISYMRAHLPNASELTHTKTLTWTPEMYDRYENTISISKSKVMLIHPDLTREFCLSVDASNYAVRACLFRRIEHKNTDRKTIICIGFSSKALTKSRRTYSTTKKEL